MTKIRVWDCTRIIELSIPHMTFMDYYEPPRFSCQVSSLGSYFCSVNRAVDLKINCIGEKVNYGQFTVKLHNFLSTSTFQTRMYHLINFGSQFLKKFDQISKRAKWSKLGFLTEKGQFLIFDLENDQLV